MKNYKNYSVRPACYQGNEHGRRIARIPRPHFQKGRKYFPAQACYVELQHGANVVHIDQKELLRILLRAFSTPQPSHTPPQQANMQFHWSSTQVVLINLKRRPERLQHMLELTRQLPMLHRIQLFEGIDWTIEGPTKREQYAREELGLDLTKLPLPKLGLPSFGCPCTLLSHLSVWVDFLERSEAQFLLVLEDDLFMPMGVEDTKAALWELEGTEFDFAWLEHHETSLSNIEETALKRFIRVEAQARDSLFGLGIYSREVVRRLLALFPNGLRMGQASTQLVSLISFPPIFEKGLTNFHGRNANATRLRKILDALQRDPVVLPTSDALAGALSFEWEIISAKDQQLFEKIIKSVWPAAGVVFDRNLRNTDGAGFGLEQFRWSSTQVMLINLKRRPERLQHMLKLTRQLPMLDRVHVFEALDGGLLGKDGLRKYAEEQLNIDKLIPATEHWGKPVSTAGTLLSHLSVWVDFLERSEAQFLLVLEDDLLMPAGVEDTKAALGELENVEFDIAWLEYFEPNSTLTKGRGRFLEVEAETEHATIWGLGASVFSREAVRRLVAAVRRDPVHVADFYAMKELIQDKFYMRTSRPLRACISQPAVFQQDFLLFESDNRLFNTVMQLVDHLNHAATEANQTLALQQYLRIVIQGRHEIDQNHEGGDVKESDMEAGLLRVLSICFETVWKLGVPSKESISQMITHMRLDDLTETQMSTLTLHLDPKAAQLLQSARASFSKQDSASNTEDLSNHSRENVAEKFRWSSTQVVLINLKRRPERLQHMLELTRQLPMLGRVQVFEAIDGKLLGEDGLRKYAAEQLRIDKEVIPATDRDGRPSSIAGTLLSHLSVWVDFLERSEAQFLLVLEDDLLMPAGVEDTKAALWELEGVEFDIAWLEYFEPNSTLTKGRGRFLEVEAETEHAAIWGLGASVFSREAVRRLVAAVRRDPTRSLDAYAMKELVQDKFYVRTSRPLRACISQPAVFYQDWLNFESDNRLFNTVQKLVDLLNDAMTEVNETLALQQYLRIVIQGRHEIDQNHNNFINYTRHPAAEGGDVKESDMEAGLLRVLSICFETVWKLGVPSKESISQMITLMRLDDLTETQMSTLTLHLDPKAAQLLQSARARFSKQDSASNTEDLSNHSRENVAEQFRWSSTQVVLINLKRRPERLQHMLELTRQLPMLGRVQVFEAIDGKLLGEDGLRKYAAEQLRIDKEVIPATDRDGRPSSIAGTLLSHLSVWVDFLERSEAQFLLVLEDDLFMPAGVEDTKAALWELENVEFDIAWLEYFEPNSTLTKGRGRFLEVEAETEHATIWGLGASVFSREAVRRLVAAVRRNPTRSPDFYAMKELIQDKFYMRTSRPLRACISQPAVFQQDFLLFESDNRLFNTVMQLVDHLNHAATEANQTLALQQYLRIVIQGRHEIDQNHEGGDVKESDMEAGLLRVLSICFETVWKLGVPSKESISQMITHMRLDDLAETQISTLTLHLDPKAAQLLQSARASFSKQDSASNTEDLSNHSRENVAEKVGGFDPMSSFDITRLTRKIVVVSVLSNS
eukprot:g37926.t1